MSVASEPEWMWSKETRPLWDDAKDALFADEDLAAVGMDRPEIGTAVADEWWDVTEQDGGDIVAYGWLDSEWGDAQIAFFVAADVRARGAGGFIVDRLCDEAREHGLRYVYNVVPDGHPRPEAMRKWLQARGFVDAGNGELRRKV